MRDHSDQNTIDLFGAEPRSPVREEAATVLQFPPKRSNQSPRCPLNSEVRSREYLTADEIEALMKAAGNVGRHRHRDRTLILIGYRHGLRVSELVSLRWDMVDMKVGRLHVQRLKNGTPSVHPLRGPELRALRKLQREYPGSPYLFVSEQKGPITTSTVRKLIARAGCLAGLTAVHPHQLRHSCGFKLANDGQDTRAIQEYLGHRSIESTVRYTALSSTRFNSFWTD